MTCGYPTKSGECRRPVDEGMRHCWQHEQRIVNLGVEADEDLDGEEEVSPFDPVPTTTEPLRPPQDAVKAEDWEQEDPTLPWQWPHCRECNKQMWTRMPERHDLCEECGYLIRVQIQDLATAQRTQNTDRLINPFAENLLSGQSGSLPTPKDE